MEKVEILREDVEKLDKIKQNVTAFNDLNDFARSNIAALRQYYLDIEEV